MALALMGLTPAAWATSTAGIAVSGTGSFVVGGTINVILTVSNDSTANTVAVSSSQTLSLPTGLTFTGTNSTTCTGLTINAGSGSTSLTLSGTGTVPAASGSTLGSCTITVQITGSTVNGYTLTLPQGFFTTTPDNSDPPSDGSAQTTVQVTNSVPVGITLYSTRGTTSTTVPVYNGLYSNNAADFPVANVTRLRWVLTNSNPFPLTNLALSFPGFTNFSAIDSTFIAGSLDTAGASLYTGSGTPKATIGCGGTLTVAPYTVNPPTLSPGFAGSISSFPATPVTLTNATIPANTSCEISFLARWDVGDASLVGGVPTLNGGNTYVQSPVFSSGAITNDQGIGAAGATIAVNLSYSNYQRIQMGTGQASSGYYNAPVAMTLTLSNVYQTTTLTPITTTNPGGLLYSVGAGLTMDLTKFPVAGGGSCPALPASAWTPAASGGGGTLAFASTIPALTGCSYSLPFLSNYTAGAGDPAYLDTQVCLLPNGPDGIAGNADDPYVTLTSGLTYKLGIAGNTCTSYRAISGSSANPNAVQIGYQLLDRTGAPTTTLNAGAAGTVQLTLTAPAGVTNYTLATDPVGTANLTNNDPSLGYVPAASTSCTGATLTATPGQASFSISNVNLTAGSSCTISVPVVNTDAIGVPSGIATFSILTCGGIGTIGGQQVCSTGVNALVTGSNAYFNFTETLSPAIADPSTASVVGTVYTFTLTKPADTEPVEQVATITRPLTMSTGTDYGLQATQILTNTCNATVNGVTGTGALPPNLTSLSIANISTPDAQARGVIYATTPGSTLYDARAFNAQTCTLTVRVVPTTNTSTGGTDTLSVIGGTQMGTTNGGTTPPATGISVRTIYTAHPAISYGIVTGTPTAPTIVKTITPNVIAAGGTATMTITLNNSTGTTIGLTDVAFGDTYPPGLINASPANAVLATTTSPAGTACSGTITAAPGGASLSFANGYIPSGNVCTITVTVTSTSTAPMNNTIAIGALTNQQGLPNTSAATGSLSLSASIGAVLQFSPSTLNYDPTLAASNTSVLKLSILNSFGNAASPVAVSSFPLPSGMQVNGTPTTVGTGCTLTTSAATGSTSVAITGGTVPASATCELDIPVILTSAPTSASQGYAVSVPAGELTATVPSSGTPSNAAAASATLTVAQPATISVSKLLAGSPTGTPTSAAPTGTYAMSLTCANTNGGAALPVNVTLTTAGSQPVQANDTCTLTENTGSLPSLPSGYSWGTGANAPAYAPNSGSIATTAGQTTSASVTNTVVASTTTVNVSSVFNPGTVGGTPPTASLDCTPSATGSAPGYTVTTGASCTLKLTGGTVPAGYSAGTTTFSGTGITIDASGNFTVPASGGSVAASTPLTAQSQTLTVSSNVFNPAIAGGTLPTITLTCTPAGSGLTAPTGASCTLGTSGAAAPNGYALGTTTFTGTGVTAGAFTMPAGGLSVTASTSLTAQAQSITISSVFNPAITGGTAPTITLTGCTVSGTYPNLQVPTGETCSLSAGAATAPNGYSAGTTTFAGSTGITIASGSFTVPAGGGTVTATTPLTAQPQSITISSVFNPAITGGTAPTITVNCGTATVAGTYPNLQIPTGASCSLTAGAATAPNGYSAGTTTFAGSTGITIASGSFTVPTGGGTITATTPLTAQPQSITISSVFNPAITGGTTPMITVNCTPTAVTGTYPNLSVPTGETCSLSAGTATAPSGYSAGTTTFAGSTGITIASGSFTVPAGGGTITATTPLTAQTQTLTLSSNAFSPNVTDSVSVLPTIALTCNPAATGSLSAPTGANCTINASNANAPNGYQLGTTTFTGSAITDTGTGAFVMPSGGFSLTVTTTLNENTAQTITLPASGNTFSENGNPITGGTLPTVTLTCSPAATEVAAGSAWTVPQGASCTLGVPGSGTGAAIAPDGYTLGTTTFGGITFTSGSTFTVPGSAVSLTVTTELTAQDQPVSLATSGGNVFVPAVSGGTLPTITLTCSPTETVITAGSAWTAKTGAACQFQASGAEPPPGYTLGATTFEDGSGSSGGSDSSRLGSVVPAMRSPRQASAVVDPNTGAFIVPAGGVPNVVVRTALLRLAPAVPVPFDNRWLMVLGGLLLALGMGRRYTAKMKR